MAAPGQEDSDPHSNSGESDLDRLIDEQSRTLAGLTKAYKSRMVITLDYQVDGSKFFRVKDTTTYTVKGRAPLVYGASEGEVVAAHKVAFDRYDSNLERVSLFTAADQQSIEASLSDCFTTLLSTNNVQSGTRVAIETHYTMRQNSLFYWVSALPVHGCRMYISPPPGYRFKYVPFMRSQLSINRQSTDDKYEPPFIPDIEPTLKSDYLILPFQGVGWVISQE